MRLQRFSAMCYEQKLAETTDFYYKYNTAAGSTTGVKWVNLG